ncbi:hypothetical protein KKA17_07260 [bacterium]|nr:hypothetical protein [bacterium]MBU1883186.1 hypothetical protein [bacterium]
MQELNKWADRVYAENDFGRSISTSISGVVGLITYLFTKDWVLTILSLIIIFPIFRIISSGLHEKYQRNKQKNLKKEDVEQMYNRLSNEEKDVIRAFVNAGGCVLTWRQMNSEQVSSVGVESLIERELLRTSYTADSMRETFVLDSDIFDIDYDKFNAIKKS